MIVRLYPGQPKGDNKMDFNDAWKEIISICLDNPGFYIELSYRRVRAGSRTTTECVLVDDYSSKEIAAPTFRACIDEYRSIMDIPVISGDTVSDRCLECGEPDGKHLFGCKMLKVD